MAQIFRDSFAFEPRTSHFGSEEGSQIGEDVFIILRLLFFCEPCVRRPVFCRSDKRNLRQFLPKHLPNIIEREIPVAVLAFHTNRCSAIRTEVKRGTIPAEIGEAAKVLALEHKKTAMMDDNYAKKQYKKDMSREKLYHDAGLK